MAAVGCSSATAARQVPPAAGNRSCAGASTSYTQPAASLQRRAAPTTLQPQRRRRGGGGTAAPRRLVLAAAGAGEIVEVKNLKGIRVVPNEEQPQVEYLVEWKDGSPDTWEPAANLADNLLRDYEQRWWGAVKKGDEETVLAMMTVGGDVLARTVNEDRRSALHFAAAMGKAPLAQKLLEAGAEVDLSDKEGYTPLHMAAGYMHTTTIGALLAGGADPEQADRQGRSPLELVEGLRAGLPAGNPMLVQRRMQLENVIQLLTANMFEDVDPMAVLGKRVRRLGAPTEEEAAAEAAADAQDVAAPAALKAEGEEEKKTAEEEAAAGPSVEEWLIKFADDEEPVWVEAKYVSQEVVEDYETGLEYAQAECVLDVRQRGTMRKYLVRWRDDYPDTWEPEEHVSRDLIALYERQQSLSDASGDADGDEEGSSGAGGGGGGAAVPAAATAQDKSAGALQLQGSPA